MSADPTTALLAHDTVLALSPSADIEWVEVEDQLIVWNGATGELHRLDPIATLVFRLCDGTSRLTDTVADLALAFGCDPDQIHGDVARCAETLRAGGLVDIV